MAPIVGKCPGLVWDAYLSCLTDAVKDPVSMSQPFTLWANKARRQVTAHRGMSLVKCTNDSHFLGACR